jgi:methylmalonyl-CoA mutase, N-terminal domain
MSRNETDIRTTDTAPKPPQAGAKEAAQLPLFSKETTEKVRAENARWKKETHDPIASKRAPWKKDFTTVSSMEINPLATPDDVADLDAVRDLGLPGEFPYTRGIHPTGYRGKLWTMRQFAGFGTAKQSNERYKYLLAQGQHGLSIAFHLPTLYGYDSDHQYAKGEVGKCGVAVDSARRHGDDLRRDQSRGRDRLDDDQLDLADPARDVPRGRREAGRRLEEDLGTLQNDILKEYIAQKEYIFPPRPSMRLITDIFKFCAENVPKYNTISISGYHIREAGSTALQELAFTLRDGMEYVEYGIARGSTSTTSRRACRSSSTRTTTSSRRSRSSAPRGGSGRRSCATASGRRTPAPGCSASTRRPPAAR